VHLHSCSVCPTWWRRCSRLLRLRRVDSTARSTPSTECPPRGRAPRGASGTPGDDGGGGGGGTTSMVRASMPCLREMSYAEGGAVNTSAETWCDIKLLEGPRGMGLGFFTEGILRERPTGPRVVRGRSGRGRSAGRRTWAIAGSWKGSHKGNCRSGDGRRQRPSACCAHKQRTANAGGQQSPLLMFLNQCHVLGVTEALGQGPAIPTALLAFPAAAAFTTSLVCSSSA